MIPTLSILRWESDVESHVMWWSLSIWRKKMDKHGELWDSLTPPFGRFLDLVVFKKHNSCWSFWTQRNYACLKRLRTPCCPIQSMRTAPGWGGGWDRWDRVAGFYGETFRRWRHMDDPTLRNSVLEYPTQWQELLCSLGGGTEWNMARSWNMVIGNTWYNLIKSLVTLHQSTKFQRAMFKCSPASFSCFF